MEQELRYARLLEIPVESCTVITKKSKKRKVENKEERLKNKAIAEVNRQAEALVSPQAEAEFFAKNPLPVSAEKVSELTAEEGAESAETQATAEALPTLTLSQAHAPEIPSRFAPFTGEGAEGAVEDAFSFDATGEDGESESVLPVCEIIEELPEERVKERFLPKPKGRRVGVTLTAVFCTLLSVAFLLNAFVFRLDLTALVKGENTAQAPADNRLKDAFSLTLPTAGEYVIANGVMQFSGKGGVYATESGTVSALTEGEDGTFTMEISHSDLFKTVITGVSMPFNEVGERVYRAQPVAYGMGETVSVSFYENGVLLNCAVEEGTLKV